MRRREIARRAGSGDRGSASIWVLTLGSLVLLVGALTMTRSAIGVGRARAAAAADVAALAGAQHLVDGSACLWAREAARRNTAELADCRPGAADVTVSVAVPVHLLFWPFPTQPSVRATARAGLPAELAPHLAPHLAADRHPAQPDSLSCLQPIRCDCWLPSRVSAPQRGRGGGGGRAEQLAATRPGSPSCGARFRSAQSQPIADQAAIPVRSVGLAAAATDVLARAPPLRPGSVGGVGAATDCGGRRARLSGCHGRLGLA